MLRMLSYVIVPLLLGTAMLGQSNAAQPLRDVSATQGDAKAIQQLEDDWLEGERTTDIAVIERVLADDYVNLTPRGIGTGKAEMIEHLRSHAGQAPPYSLQADEMHIYVLDNVAVAAYTKTYTAKENGNVQREDNTHIFRKDHGGWKLKISRETFRPSE